MYAFAPSKNVRDLRARGWVPPDVQSEMKSNSPPWGGVYDTMKIGRLFTLSATVLLAFGLTTAQSQIDSYHGRTDIPLPVKNVAPDADPSLAGTKGEIEFIADVTGTRRNGHVVSAMDNAFGTAVRDAVARWQFAPARPSGTPLPMAVLPLVVVAQSERTPHRRTRSTDLKLDNKQGRLPRGRRPWSFSEYWRCRLWRDGRPARQDGSGWSPIPIYGRDRVRSPPRQTAKQGR